MQAASLNAVKYVRNAEEMVVEVEVGEVSIGAPSCCICIGAGGRNPQTTRALGRDSAFPDQCLLNRNSMRLYASNGAKTGFPPPSRSEKVAVFMLARECNKWPLYRTR